MEVKTARRMGRVSASETVKLGNLVAKLKSEGRDIISFSVGEPDFPTPQHIIDAGKKAMDEGFTKYTPSRGIPDLRNAIAERTKRENGIPCTEENVLVTPTKHALFMACMALIDDGDEVILPEPCWVSYEPCVSLSGGKAVPINTCEDDLCLNLEKVASSVTKRTRMIILNSPNNPTGGVLGRDELKGVADLAEDHDFLILSDEIYERILFEGRHVSAASLGNAAERTIVINGLSKSYSMTGWRLGWMVAPKAIVEQVDTIQQHSITCAPSFVQKAALAALQGPQDCVEKMVGEFRKRRDFMVQRLCSMKGVKCPVPKGAFYTFPEFEHDVCSKDMAEYLLKEANVAVTPGSAFGRSCDRYLRFSYATSLDNIRTGLDRMERALEKRQ